MNQKQALKIMEEMVVDEMDRVMVATQRYSHPLYPALGKHQEYMVSIGIVYSYGDSFEEAIKNFSAEKKSKLDKAIAELEALIKKHEAR